MSWCEGYLASERVTIPSTTIGKILDDVGTIDLLKVGCEGCGFAKDESGRTLLDTIEQEQWAHLARQRGMPSCHWCRCKAASSLQTSTIVISNAFGRFVCYFHMARFSMIFMVFKKFLLVRVIAFCF